MTPHKNRLPASSRIPNAGNREVIPLDSGLARLAWEQMQEFSAQQRVMIRDSAVLYLDLRSSVRRQSLFPEHNTSSRFRPSSGDCDICATFLLLPSL
ncbi:hypothetical protein BaRGS_00016066 [Batillaria attramentaria]|uniref:Uncharacterized protein n=1 Tax=Batillaria attramentaria TaxID=370345 RepID=A0ABD0KZT3_9CAEN